MNFKLIFIINCMLFLNITYKSFGTVQTEMAIQAIKSELPPTANFDNPACGHDEWTVKFEQNAQARTLGIKIPKNVLADIIAKQPDKIETNTPWQLTKAYNFKLTSIDPTNKKIWISFNISEKKWEYIQSCFLIWCRTDKIKTIDVNCNGTSSLTPELNISGNSFTLTTNDAASQNCTASGLFPTLTKILVGPFMGAPTPGANVLLGSATSAILNAVATNFSNDAIEDKNNTISSSFGNEYKDVWLKVQELISAGVLISIIPKLDENGLWLNFSYTTSNAVLVNAVVTKLNDLYLQNNPNDMLNAIALKYLGRYLTPAELDLYVNDYNHCVTLTNIIENITYDLKVKNEIYMNSFINNKISNKHSQLIISLSGAGPYLKGAISQTNGPIEVLTIGDRPSNPDDFGDGIYKTAANFIDSKTIGIIGYPWPNGTGSVDNLDSYWGPEQNALAQKIKEILSKMKPNSKLVLVGKSLGGCRMQQLVGELNTLGISIDLLILVDASCSFLDPNQGNLIKSIPQNVKKVYNFYQRQVSDIAPKKWTQT